MTDDARMLKNSVTADEVTKVEASGNVIRFIVPMYYNTGFNGYNNMLPPPQAPDYWSIQRDAILRGMIHWDAAWASAVYIAASKLVTQAFQVTSSVPKRAKEAQELILNFGGRRNGYVTSLYRCLRDYFTTDNGMFIEIVRATSAIGSKIIGLMPLDSLRCTRTGDPQIPVIYRDIKGKYHALRDHQVLMMADMPDPGDSFHGVGLCATARAYQEIYKLMAITRYINEKVTGARPLAVHIVNGIVGNQVQDVIKGAQSEEIGKGVMSFMGAVIVSNPSQVPPEVATINLAEFPDRFDRKEEFDIALIIYADTLGLDPQDLQPLSSSALGSGSQSVILDNKSKGRGAAAWRQDFLHQINQYVLDDLTEMLFIEQDFRDQKQKAEIEKAHADVAAARITSGVTDAQIEQQILVEAGDIPKELVPDNMQTETITDTEKPNVGESQSAEAKVGAGALEKKTAVSDQVQQPKSEPKKEAQAFGKKEYDEGEYIPLIEPVNAPEFDDERYQDAYRMLILAMEESVAEV